MIHTCTYIHIRDTNVYIQTHIYGTPQSKQSIAPENGEFFFETPLKIAWVGFFLIFFTYSSYSWCISFRKYQVSTFRCYLGCVPHTQSWVFFQNGQNTAFWLLYYSASKKPTARVFIWCDKEYPNVHFEYKTVTERYLVAELWAKQFWGVF